MQGRRVVGFENGAIPARPMPRDFAGNIQAHAVSAFRPPRTQVWPRSEEVDEGSNLHAFGGGLDNS